MTALDVGQGSAVLIETRERAWLYDAGPRYCFDTDAGERIVLPYLRHRGIAPRRNDLSRTSTAITRAAQRRCYAASRCVA